MFCAIRKFKNKKSLKGSSKRIEVYTSKYERDLTKYCFTFSHDKFDRPPRDSYQISIQHSYRDDGKVQKKQWKVATINYYDFIENYTSWKDFITQDELNELLFELDMTLTQLERMINVKLHPLLNEIITDWEQTEEYNVTREINRILEKHYLAKKSFEEKWGTSTYDYIFDVFGKLRNKNYLDWIQQEAQGKDKSYSKSSNKNKYNDENRSNSQHDRSTKKTNSFRYSEEEKKWLKKFYRSLAKEFHPDVNGNTDAMVLINKLKKDWDL